jgi:large subunit ribosomal protein L5
MSLARVAKGRPRHITMREEPRYKRQQIIPKLPVKVTLRDTHASRLADHYHITLKEDLMYLTYNHRFEGERSTYEKYMEREIRPKYDPENPYSKSRANPPVGGPTHTGILRKPLPPSSPENVVRLENIQLHTFVKDALSSRSNLLPAIMALRTLSGMTREGGGHHTAEGVQIVKGKKAETGWIRPGLPCGVKVELKGEMMWTFLSTLTTFVLPRLKDFTGFTLPAASATPYSPSAVSGVVNIGLPPAAMALFPQIEGNVDSYPKLYGFHINFITNARGIGAQAQARQLLSGFQIPFARR